MCVELAVGCLLLEKFKLIFRRLEYHKIREVIGQMGVWKVVYRALGWTEYLI